ncbi:MAG: hypothetical protein BGO01_20630 [Armatimonadetes bacterium 55-13]|nr:MAG: hypothetical protein BGO01_20630 [Armatimonadetes bacterium 55-13]
MDVWGQLGAVEGFQFCETMDTQSDPLVYDALYPGDGWRSWIKQYFPHVASKPFAKRHERVWDWFDSLEFNCPPPDPDIEIWGRGGAKSTTLELGVAYVGAKLSRPFVLYVSETQDQAREHVQSIGDYLEAIGVQRLTGVFGNQKGWRKDQLRTAHGFNVMALGLDVAARGIKLGSFRPGLIVFDDLDGTEDTAKTTAKKIRQITKKLLPAGSTDCAVIGGQNLIIPDGIFAQLYDGRADFLANRQVHLEPAVINLQTEGRVCEDGRTRHFIIGGDPTWVGQDLEVCQKQIFDWGILAFREEAQHEVYAGTGYFFDEKAAIIVQEFNADSIVRIVRAWDTAATQGAGDFTVGVLMALTANGVVWILDVVRAQLSSDNVDALVAMVTAWDRSRFGAKYHVRMPQDPGSAGKKVAQQDQRKHGAVIEAVTGTKAKRAEKYAARWNEGNVRLLQDGHPRLPAIDRFLDEVTKRTELEGKTLHWIRPLLTEYRRFCEDESHDFDDQVDAGADAFNFLMLRSDVLTSKPQSTGLPPHLMRKNLSQDAVGQDSSGRIIPPKRSR